jgi:hypothetical protein
MNTRVLLNLALLAAVVALAWLALREQPPGPVSDTGLALTALAPAEVVRIGIERHGQAAVTLERVDRRWLLTAPLALPADEFRVQALLALVAARSEAGFRAAGNDLGQFGLEPPQAVLRFDDVVLAVGNTEPLSGRRYLLADGEVHLIEDRWFSQIFGAPAAWADPRPLPADAKPVRIVLPDASWRLHEGRWRREPPDPSLSADAGPLLADAWRLARAITVRARDPDLPWGERVLIELADAPAGIAFELARVPDALVLGRPDLGLQYRFLERQAGALLGH